MGRLMYHSQEVKHNRRKFLGKELLWELPFVIGMAIVAEGAGEWMGLSQKMTVALVGVASYYGPRAFEIAVARALKTSQESK